MPALLGELHVEHAMHREVGAEFFQSQHCPRNGKQVNAYLYATVSSREGDTPAIRCL